MRGQISLRTLKIMRSWIDFLLFALVLSLNEGVRANDNSNNVCSADDKSCSADFDCIDMESACAQLAKTGDCKSNPLWMLTHCPFSCNHCPKAYG